MYREHRVGGVSDRLRVAVPCEQQFARGPFHPQRHRGIVQRRIRRGPAATAQYTREHQQAARSTPRTRTRPAPTASCRDAPPAGAISPSISGSGSITAGFTGVSGLGWRRRNYWRGLCGHRPLVEERLHRLRALPREVSIGGGAGTTGGFPGAMRSERSVPAEEPWSSRQGWSALRSGSTGFGANARPTRAPTTGTEIPGSWLRPAPSRTPG